MQTDNYIVKSLELHLFFGRIMKEHSFFLEAGFTPAGASFAAKAEHFKQEFEKLLCQAIALSGGLVSQPVLRADELVTEFTATAERQSERLTGIAIDKTITARQLRLRSGCGRCDREDKELRCAVQQLNQTALRLLSGLISFKETVLRNVLRCELFTLNYPLLIEHILREAKLYREYVQRLERDGDLTDCGMKEVECFWNQIMMEHALFIRGLLDPSETELFDAADGFAKDYGELLERCRRAQDQTMTAEALEKTIKFRDFKAAGTQGIEQCKIRSIILPLLADHVLREANHYIRLLNCRNG